MEQARLTDAVARGDRWAGKGGDTYPVKWGQTWKVGSHTITCSDLMNSPIFDELLEAADPAPTLLYCDPPWGQGLVNSFRTKAGLPHANYRWEQLYRHIADLGHSRGLPVWLEGSVITSRDGAKIFGAMRRLDGPPNCRYWEIAYANNQPAGLYYSGPVEYPFDLTATLAGLHDRHTPGAVMSAYPIGVVVEPCSGLGGTSANAEKAGWASLANEINPFRLSSSLVRLEALTGQKAERTG